MEDYYWEILSKILIVLPALSLLFGYLYLHMLNKFLNNSDEVVKDQKESKHKSKPNISEPVISFVKTFKENPKRFTYVKDKDRENIINPRVSYINKVLTDTFTKEVFKITEINLCRWELYQPNIILTKDEIDYIDKEIVTPYKERKARYIETKLNRECVQEKRKEVRKELQERRRLTKIYQQEK